MGRNGINSPVWGYTHSESKSEVKLAIEQACDRAEVNCNSKLCFAKSEIERAGRRRMKEIVDAFDRDVDNGNSTLCFAKGEIERTRRRRFVDRVQKKLELLKQQKKHNTGIVIEIERVVGARGEKLIRVTRIIGLSSDSLPRQYLEQPGAVVVESVPFLDTVKALWITVKSESVDPMLLSARPLLIEGQEYPPAQFKRCVKYADKAGKMLAEVNRQRREQAEYEKELLDWAGKTGVVKI
jgi:hypothetical protein